MLICQCCRNTITQDEADRGNAVCPEGIVTTVCEECAVGLKESAESVEIDSVPVTEVRPGVYEDSEGNVQVDSLRIQTYNGIPITEDE